VNPAPPVYAALDALGIAYQRFEHPPVFTSEEADIHWRDLPGVPCKNLFLRNKKGNHHYLVILEISKKADAIVYEELARIGINVRDPQQAVGTLSGGERQCVAIARAVYHGARVLILDEPTSALGVHQASIVLRYVAQARARGLAVIFITHNIHHAYPIGDVFTMLNRGRSLGTFRRGDITEKEVLDMMAGGREIRELQQELERFTKPGSGAEAAIS